MLKKLYIKLVTRNENVRATYTRYKKLHPRLHDKARILSWIYLICLILKFSVFKQKPNLKYPEAGTEKQPSIDYINEKIKQADVIFGGRLGQYKYYDMDKFILAAFETLKEENLK